MVQEDEGLYNKLKTLCNEGMNEEEGNSLDNIVEICELTLKKNFELQVENIAIHKQN